MKVSGFMHPSHTCISYVWEYGLCLSHLPPNTHSRARALKIDEYNRHDHYVSTNSIASHTNSIASHTCTSPPVYFTSASSVRVRVSVFTIHGTVSVFTIHVILYDKEATSILKQHQYNMEYYMTKRHHQYTPTHISVRHM